MSIREIQTALKNMGYDPGPIDGINGPRTKAAVKKFQQDQGITVDGIWGPQTTKAYNNRDSGGSTSSSKTSTSTDSKSDVGKYLQENFPSYAWAVDHGEIGPILKQAAKEDWDAVRLRGAIEGSDWWQSTSDTARQAKLQQENDPKTWSQRMSAKTAEIETIAQEMGVRLTAAQKKKVANETLTMGLNPQQLQTAILANSNYNKITLRQIEEGGVGGTLAQIENAIEQTTDEWLIGLPDSTKLKWIRDVAEGRKNIDQLRNYAEKMARKNMPHLADMFDEGITAREAVEPYQQTVADSLERPGADIDLMDPRFKKSMTDDEGNLVSLTQMQQNIRREYFDEWNETSRAQQSASGLVNEIAKMFGRRA